MTLYLNNISKYLNKNWILKNLNFEVKDGECLVLLGPSGCGKSSTLRIIGGLDKPTEGSIYLDTQDITSMSPVKRKIAMVFQSYALFPHLNIRDNLSLGLKVRGNKDKIIKNKVDSILNLMQINHLQLRKPSEISGGQKQRVALARALLREPNLYLLDEPMSNLDAQLREQLRPELSKLIINGNQPVIYVTHDQHEAMAMAHRIAIMKNGEIQQIDTPKNLYEKPNSIFVANFIGRPQINIFSFNDKLNKGIRPEDIYIREGGHKCKVIYKEWLGSYQLLSLESDFGIIRMTSNLDLNISDNISINWDSSKEHLFDANKGTRIN